MWILDLNDQKHNVIGNPINTGNDVQFQLVDTGKTLLFPKGRPIEAYLVNDGKIINISIYNYSHDGINTVYKAKILDF